MPIFHWENLVIQWAAGLPHQGELDLFMNFSSDFSESKWLIFAGLILLALVIGIKRIIIPTLLAAVSVGLGDLASRRIVKALVMRPRPQYVGLDCHMSACWGFVSSHATNVTAAAVALTLYDRRNAWWTLPVVIVVGFSRIYLVDHFPLDVIGGIVLGTLVGFVVWFGYLKFLHMRQLREAKR